MHGKKLATFLSKIKNKKNLPLFLSKIAVFLSKIILVKQK